MALVSCSHIGEALTNWLENATTAQKEALCEALGCGPSDDDIAGTFLKCAGTVHLPGDSIPTCDEMDAAIAAAIAGGFTLVRSNSSTVTLSGTGTTAAPLVASARVSGTPGNTLQVTSSGLYVPTPPSAYSPANVSLEASGSGTFTVPEGVTSLYVQMVGGGGGGGSAGGSIVNTDVYPGLNGGGGGGGGGAGEYLQFAMTVTPGQVIAYTVGKGGGGGAGVNPSTASTLHPGQAGGDGGDTVFGTYTAAGGAGGGAGGRNPDGTMTPTDTGPGGAGGAGGNGAASGNYGDDGRFGGGGGAGASTPLGAGGRRGRGSTWAYHDVMDGGDAGGPGAGGGGGGTAYQMAAIADRGTSGNGGDGHDGAIYIRY